jgi:polar amino acid transport system substrate-binding protein
VSRRSALAALAVLTSLALAGAPRARAAEPGAPPLTLVVGGDRDYPPYEFLDQDGQPAGYNVELSRAIAEVMGMKVEFRLGGWPDVRRELQQGRTNAVQGMSYSEERARQYDYSPPHTIVNHAIFAREGTPRVASLEELRGHAVLVHQAGIMDEVLSGMGMGGQLLRTSTPAEALRLLAAGEGEYAVVAALPGTYITKQSRLTNVVRVAPNVASQRYGFAVRKGDRELLSRITEGLAILKQTGRYDEIHQKWLGVLEPATMSWKVFLKYGAVLVLPLLLVLGGTVMWSSSLRREVAVRTESLARAVEELRVNQAQLVQADKMAALGILVSGVAHEINNPNGYILLNMPVLKDVYRDAAELFEERYRERGDFQVGGLRWSAMREELPGMLDEMLEGARRIKRIVEDLKDFARPDARQREPTDLNAVVQAALRLIGNPLKRATHRLEVSLADGLPAVLGNAQRIEQVVVNLVLNACQALPDPERAIRISTRLDRERGLVVLAVEDEGVGIPSEHLPRLTDPFFTTKRERGGTGLGLSVTSGIVKEHGGTLEFRSEPGEGTTVLLALPAAPAAAEAEEVIT